MTRNSANHEQYGIWNSDAKFPQFPSLDKAAVADVVIIGGGITGLISAYLLSKTGKKVIVLEKNKLISGATADTTAFLTQIVDIDMTSMIKMYGLAESKAISTSHKAGIELIKSIVVEHNIDCDLEYCSNHIYANEESDLTFLRSEFVAAKKLGLNPEWGKKPQDLIFKNSGYIEIPDQAKFHPLKFLVALANILLRNGVQIFEKTEAKKITPYDGAILIKTNTHNLTSKWAIVATYEPFNKAPSLYFKKEMNTSYVFELEIMNANLKEGMYEDTANPYHYMRIDDSRYSKKGTEIENGASTIQRVILGGEDHRSKIKINPEKKFNALKQYIDKIFVDYPYEIVRKWRGAILEPVRGLASIGPIDHKQVLYATAFSGNGMTYSAISAIIFKDIIDGKKNSWLKTYLPTRTISTRTLNTKEKRKA